MTQSAIAAKMIDAINAAADREAGAATGLVSVTIDVLGAASDAAVDVKLVRKTRTLVFMRAEALSDTSVRLMTASSVHKVLRA